MASSQVQVNWLDRFKEHFIVVLLSMLVTGFFAGIGAAKFFVDFTGQVLITRSELTELKKTEKNYQDLVKKYPSMDGRITDPQDREAVARQTIFKGKISRNLGANEHLWLVVNPFGSSGWFPQRQIAPKHDKSWEQEAPIEEGQQDIGRSFNVAVVLADKSANDKFTEYLENGRIHNEYPSKPLPNGTTILDKITVIRK